VIYDGKGGALKITPEKTADVLVIEPRGGCVSLNGFSYRGSLEIHNVLAVLMPSISFL
jgi:hypothetical protein